MRNYFTDASVGSITGLSLENTTLLRIEALEESTRHGVNGNGRTEIVRDRPLVKIRFELNPDDWHGYGSETVWAEPVAAGRYRLRNTPFYARGVSADDVVFGSTPDETGVVPFNGMSIRGGHSTYRIIPNLETEEDDFEEAWRPLQALGCTYEKGDRRVFAVDVPQQAAIQDVYALLEKGEAGGIWNFEEGHCGHPLRS